MKEESPNSYYQKYHRWRALKEEANKKKAQSPAISSQNYQLQNQNQKDEFSKVSRLSLSTQKTNPFANKRHPQMNTGTQTNVDAEKQNAEKNLMSQFLEMKNYLARKRNKTQSQVIKKEYHKERNILNTNKPMRNRFDELLNKYFPTDNEHQEKQIKDPEFLKEVQGKFNKMKKEIFGSPYSSNSSPKKIKRSSPILKFKEQVDKGEIEIDGLKRNSPQKPAIFSNIDNKEGTGPLENIDIIQSLQMQFSSMNETDFAQLPLLYYIYN